MTEVIQDPERLPDPGAESAPTGPPLSDAEEFNRRVEALLKMIDENPEIRDRLIAEMYVNIANAETALRGIFTMIQTEGLGGFLKGGLRRKRKGE